MRIRPSSIVLWPLVPVVWFCPERAHADDSVPFALEYTAPPACPDAEGFLREIATRTALPRPATPNEPATALTVFVKEIEGGFKGSLELTSAGGAASARHVSAATCDQVVSALALMTALAIDPNASTASVQKEPASARIAPARPEAKPASGELAQPSRSTRVRFELGTGLEVLAGVAPSPLFSVRPSFEVGTSGESAWGSAFRLGAGFGPDGVSGGGDFSLVSARLEACPRFRVARPIEVLACGALDGGRLEATGVGVTPSVHVERPWVAAGSTLWLEWQVVRFLVVELAGELFFPLERDRFFVDTAETVHRAPAVVGGATLGLGVRYP